MAKFSVEQAQKMMYDRDIVRNLGIIAHIDHGKSTLADSLLAASGLLAEKVAGAARATDTRDDEQERGITIKTTGISLAHDYKGKTHLINLQDTPGHVDFSGEVTSALRVVDGALVVVDAVEGVMVQTEVVTRQALQERVRPVLMINKIDRLITEMKLKPEDAYEKFKSIIRDFNILIETYAPPEFKKEWQVSPRGGTVAFGSAFHRFGLTIPALAELWANKTGKPIEGFIQAFWKKENFVKGVLGPTYEIYKNSFEGNVENLKKICKTIAVDVPESTWLLDPKKMAKAILEQWQPVHKAVLDMVCNFCPSPNVAQKYRIKSFWNGDSDSEICKGMINTDENAPTMIALSKMILTTRGKRVVAMGRVFSGTVRAGDKITVYLPGYKSGSKDRRFTTNIQQVALLMGKQQEATESICAGNIVALTGIKGAMSSSTVSSLDEVQPFSALSFAVEPVVTVAIEPKSVQDLKKVTEGMSLIQLVDPSLKTTINEETGEYLLSGTGELHLEIAVKDLQDMQKIEVKQSTPIVVFRESVESITPRPILAKSPNKHNRLWVTCEPLEPEIIKKIDAGEISQYGDKTELAELLRGVGWDKKEAQKVWGMAGGTGEVGPNLWVDATKGVQYLREVKDYIMQGFRWGAGDGPLTSSPMYGCKFRMHDVNLHEDPVHRGMAQVMPVARKVAFGAFLGASPILLEPVYKIEVVVPENYLGNVYKVITKRRGTITDTIQKEGTPLNTVIGELPVTESFGITTDLRSETSGFAFAQMVFSKWQRVPGSPSNPESLAAQYITEARKRRGMKENIPSVEDYSDKL